MTPDGWERVPLEALLVDGTPGFWGNAPNGENEIAVVRSTNLRTGGRLDVSDVVRRSFPPKKLEQKALRRGDLVLERSGGGPKQPVGRVALFDLEGLWSFSNFMQRLRPRASACESRFLTYELDRFHATGGTESLQQATTGIRNLQYRDYLARKLLVPPLGEQRKIAAILASVDDAIEATQAVIDQLQVVKKAMMAELLTRGLPGRHTRFKMTEIGEVPDEWQVVKLAHVARVTSGGTPSRERPDYWNGEIPWVKTGEINYTDIVGTDESISEAGVANSAAKIVPKGSLLVAMYGQGATRGRVALLGIDAALNQACLAILAGERAANRFLFYVFSARYDELRGLGNEGSQKNLSATLLKEVLVQLPALGEQREIVQVLSSIDARIETDRLILERGRALKSALMSVLLTGEVRVKPDEEAA